MLSPIYTDSFHNDGCLKLTVSTTARVGATYCRLIAFNVVEYSLNIRSICFVSFRGGDGQLITLCTEALCESKAHVVGGRQFSDFTGDANVKFYIRSSTHSVSP